MPQEDYGRKKVIDENIDEDHALASIEFTEEDHQVPILNYKSVEEVQASSEYKPIEAAPMHDTDSAKRLAMANRVESMSHAAGSMILAGRPLVLMTSDMQLHHAPSFWKLSWIYFKNWIGR